MGFAYFKEISYKLSQEVVHLNLTRTTEKLTQKYNKTRDVFLYENSFEKYLKGMYLQGHPMYYCFLRAQLRHLREEDQIEKRELKLKQNPESTVLRNSAAYTGPGVQCREPRTRAGGGTMPAAVLSQQSCHWGKSTADTRRHEGTAQRAGGTRVQGMVPGGSIRLAVRGD